MVVAVEAVREYERYQWLAIELSDRREGRLLAIISCLMFLNYTYNIPLQSGMYDLHIFKGGRRNGETATTE